MQQQFSFVGENQQAWLADARQRMVELLKDGRAYVTSDTVWAHCPPPKYLNPKVMGGVFTNGQFESIGFTRTRRPIAHNRPIQMYRLKNARPAQQVR